MLIVIHPNEILNWDFQRFNFLLQGTYAPLPCPLPSALPPAPRLIDPLLFHLLWGQLAACLGEPIAVLSGVPAGRRALAMRAEASFRACGLRSGQGGGLRRFLGVVA